MNAECLSADWPAPDSIVAGTTLRMSGSFQLPAEPLWLSQVHGADVVYLTPGEVDAEPPAADASIAGHPGAICAVRTADCLPLLLCAADGSEIAAVHGGWRGLAAGIVANTVRAMSTAPDRLLAWLGPAISQPAFEVGDEVREAFLMQDAVAEAAFTPNPRGRWQADLYLLARQQLSAAGVAAVFGGGLCTYSDPKRFFSYRREGQTGRLVSFVYRP